jgi:membrane protein DedA with SNARE-associated domain
MPTLVYLAFGLGMFIGMLAGYIIGIREVYLAFGLGMFIGMLIGYIIGIREE